MGVLRRYLSAAAAIAIGASAIATLAAPPAAASASRPNVTTDAPAAPTVTADATDGFSRDPTFTVTGVDPGATLDCSVSSPFGGPAVTVSVCDVSSELDLTGGDDGTYTLSVTQTDAGVTSDAGTATYTLDVTTPTITADSSIGNSSTATFTVTNIDPDTTLQCTVTDPATVTVTACGPSTAIDLTGAPDGTYTVTVDAEDSGGDISGSASDSYEYEPTAPPAPDVTAPSSPGNDQTPSFTVTDTDNVDLTYHCTVAGLPAGDITTCGPTTTLDLTGSADRTYVLKVTVKDGLGQTSASDSASYLLDTSTPVPVVTRTFPASSPSTATSPRFSITDSETPDGPDTFSCVWAAPDGTTISSGPCSSGDAFPTAGNGDGRYKLTVTATDGAGNTATAAAVRYSLETGAPPAPVVVAAQPAGSGRTASFTVTDSENVTLTYNCSLVGLPNSDITACGPTTTVNLGGASDGTYQIQVTVTDGLGHVSSAGGASYTLDTTTPAPSVALAPPLMSPSSNTSPSFIISDAEGADGPDTFSCVWQPPTGPAVNSPSCDSGDSFAATAGDGHYTLTVTATDAVGNTATAAPVGYDLEVNPPPAPVVVATTPFGRSLHPTFSVSDSENVALTYNCSVVGQPASAVATCGPTTTLDLTGDPDGSYTLVVTATDGLGQTGVGGSDDYLLDTATPSPNVALAPPLVTPSSSTAPIFSISDTESPDGPDTFSCVWHRPSGAPLNFASCRDGESFAATAGDGDYTLTVTATDAAGNTATAAPVTYTLDTTRPAAPTVTLTSPASTTGNDTSPQFTVTDPDSSPGGGLTYSCSVSGPTAVPDSAIDCGPTTTVDLSAAGDGRYRLSVVATDPSGNVSLTAGTASYTLDTTAPPPPTVTLTTPASSPGNVTSPRFSVTDADHSAGVTFSCTVTGATVVTPSEINCGATTTLDLSGGNRDGSYTLSVIATDASGNAGTPGTASYVLDTGTPLAPDVTLPVSSTKMPTFGISDPDPSLTLTCRLISPKGTLVFPSAPPGVCPANGTFNTNAFTDGSYTLTVTATDIAQNTAATTVTWVRDTTPPAAPTVTLAAPSTSPGNSTDPQFSVSDPDSSPVPGLTYSCSVTGPTVVPSTAINCGATTSVDLSGAGRDGTYRLSVFATDAAMNTSVTAGTATYTLDTSAPAAPAVSLSAPAASPSDQASPQFLVSDSDNSPGPGLTYTCSVAGPSAVPVSAINCGAPTTTVDLGAAADGIYTLSVTAVDAAGNPSGTAGTATYTLDRTPPPAPTVSLASPANSSGNVTDPTFSVSDTDPGPGTGVTYSCTVDGPSAVAAASIGCAAPTTTVDLTGATDGSYTLRVTATDSAGNTSSSAGAATYDLDTTAPLPPIVGLASATRSSSKTPLWTWQFGFNDVATTLDTASCTVNGPHAWTATVADCGHHLTTDLAGGDGDYTLTVTLTDEAGNSASASSPTYTLDSTAPAGPTVYLRHPASGAGLSRYPIWAVSGPTGSTLMCTLLQGGHDGTAIEPETVCPVPAEYSLAGEPDGLFTLRVVAVDAAHNRSFAAWATYALEPSAPQVHPPHGHSDTAVWTVAGNPNDAFSCTLTHAGKVVAGPQHCDSHPTYQMAGLARGEYTLSVVQVGAAGVRSAPGSASWFWSGVAPPIQPSVPPSGGSPSHNPAASPPRGPKGSKPPPLAPTTPLSTGVRPVHRVGHTSAPPPPQFSLGYSTNRFADGVASAVQGVANVVGSAGAGTGFPLLLLGMVFAFLIAQNRIDRRDPKLALATIAADDMVEFHLPPSRRDRA